MADEWGGLPEAFGAAELAVASAPLAVAPYGAAAVPALDYSFDQVLFGFEAQLRAAAHALRGGGRHLALAPLPEMFATPRSLAALRCAYAASARSDPGWRGGGEAAGEAALLHLRFGPARHARVLKGARNVMMLAEDPLHLPQPGSAHPFGSDCDLPAPFATVLGYGPRRGPGVVAAGRALPELPLPAGFLRADLDSEARGTAGATGACADGAGWPAWYAIAGLQVRSFAEAARGGVWLRDPSGVGGADAADWRRALALAGAGAAARPLFIMLPWNLAHPASIVPDIVRKLGRREPFDAADHRLVLFPFNATPGGHAAIEELAAELHRIACQPAGALRGLFLARLAGLQDARRLRLLFPLAWLEADDPESRWTAERLSWLGIAVGLLGVGTGTPAYRFAVAADEPIRLHVSDSFGDRSYATRSLSARRLASLMVRSRDAATGDGSA